MLQLNLSDNPKTTPRPSNIKKTEDNSGTGLPIKENLMFGDAPENEFEDIEKKVVLPVLDNRKLLPS